MKKGCCGNVVTRLDIVKNASRVLFDGHRSVSALYQSVLVDMTAAGATAEDIAEVEALIKLHDSMAQESLKVLTLE